MGENTLNYHQIKMSYSETTVKMMKETTKFNMKLANQKNRRIFLLRCKTEDLTPTFLRFKTKHIQFYSTNLQNKFSNLIMKFTHGTLNLLIGEVSKNINQLKKDITKNYNKLEHILPNNIYLTFFNYEQHKTENFFKKIKDKHINKIKKLESQRNKNTVDSINIEKEWLENLTDVNVPEHVVEILSLGSNFAMPLENNKEIPIPDILASVEISINKLPTQEKDEIRANLCNILTNYKNKNITHLKNKNQKKINQKLCQKYKKTKKFLKENNDLLILRPDKSNKTIIMTKDNYNGKMEKLLNDKTTYKTIENDPTNILQKQNNEIIKRWDTNGYVAPTITKKLTIHNSQPPKIYGLPKLHKTDIPMRPIVSCIQSPFENLSRYLKEILTNVINKNPSYIKDSWQFKNKIQNTTIPNNYIIISLDVVSLYTNTPINLVLNIIEKKWNEIKKFTDIPLKEFLIATEKCLKSTYFLYENKIYKQIEGCAMGSAISCVAAQMVLEELENTIIPKLTYNIPFFYRYVDDCLTIIPENMQKDILNNFNSFHPRLQFTIEPETDKKINFLDMTLHHNENKIETEWYTKETWSGRYLNYFSQHPISQKRSVIIGLADRAIKLSDLNYRPKAIQKAKNILVKNSYPLKLINKIFKRQIQRLYNNTQTQPNNPNKNEHHLTLPYINILSENLTTMFQKHNIKTCHKSYNLLQRNFTPLKTQTHQNKKTHIIYEIPCNDCSGVYIGQTSQYLSNRLNGHKFDKKNKTALSNHEKSTKHSFNFNNTKILKTEPNQQKREFLEMIYIKNNKNAINDKKDIKGLNKIYNNII